MLILATGIALWIGIHLIPSLGLHYKQYVVDRIGLLTYRVFFAGGILGALAIIVLGWQAAQPTSIYLPPYELRPLVVVLVVLAFVILGATALPSRIRRILRYPQMAAVLIWACAHLLANGDSRSLLLFGGFAFWAMLMMILMGRRDGTWEKKPAPSWPVEIAGIGAMLLVAYGAFHLHPWFTGMPIY
jgi:uncharacterized membrane protein